MTYSHENLVTIGHALNQGAFTVRGEEITFESGFIPSEKQLEEALLRTKKSEAIAKIDAEYEQKRQTYLTSGATMSMVYTAKYNEAKAYASNPTGNFPLLQASVDSGEVDNLEDASVLILGKAAQLAAIAASLETERLTRKRAIERARTIQEIE